MNNGQGVAPIQVPSDHYRDGYDGRGRWSSYWVQIESMIQLLSNKPALEIGIGNGTVSNYLKNVIRAEVVTVDIDPLLGADHIASITELPFQSASFGVASACEVLEHLPYDQCEWALREMRRVAAFAVISVPNMGFFIQTSLSVKSSTKYFSWSIPWLFMPSGVKVTDQHYWELGMKGYPVDRFRKSVHEAGWKIEREIRNPGFGLHHFFILAAIPSSGFDEKVT